MRAFARRPAAGLSLLEVIVVLLIAAATCLLLLPVLDRSRENARANYCGNNLRRLEQALQQHGLTKPGGLFQPIADHQRTDDALRKSRLLKLRTWPTELQPYLDPEQLQPQTFAEQQLVDRPVWLTCPSHPEVLARKNPSHALYALVEVVEPQDPSAASSPTISPPSSNPESDAHRPAPRLIWKFRDCARDLPPVNNQDVWFEGPVLLQAEAQAQLERQQGPHADGVFQQSNLEGSPERLPR